MAFIPGAYGDNQAVAPDIFKYEELQEQRAARVQQAKQAYQERQDRLSDELEQKEFASAQVNADKFKNIDPIYIPRLHLAYDEMMSNIITAKADSDSPFSFQAKANRAMQGFSEEYDKLLDSTNKIATLRKTAAEGKPLDPDSIAFLNAYNNSSTDLELSSKLASTPDNFGSWSINPDTGLVNLKPARNFDETKYFSDISKGYVPTAQKDANGIYTNISMSDIEGQPAYVVTPSPQDPNFQKKLTQVQQQNPYGDVNGLFGQFLAHNYNNPDIWQNGKAPRNADGSYSKDASDAKLDVAKAQQAYKDYLNNTTLNSLKSLSVKAPPDLTAWQKAYLGLRYQEGSGQMNSDLWKYYDRVSGDIKQFSQGQIHSIDAAKFKFLSKDEQQNMESIIKNASGIKDIMEALIPYAADKKISVEQFAQSLYDAGVLNVAPAKSGKKIETNTAQKAAAEFGGTVRNNATRTR